MLLYDVELALILTKLKITSGHVSGLHARQGGHRPKKYSKKVYHVDENYNFPAINSSFVQSDKVDNISTAPRDKGMLNYKLFFHAAEDGDINGLQSFLNGGASINMTKGNSGNTALHLVVAENDASLSTVVKFLFENGIDAGLTNRHGETALEVAQAEGCSEMVDLLKEHTNMCLAPSDELKMDSDGVLVISDDDSTESLPEGLQRYNTVNSDGVLSAMSTMKNTGSDGNDCGSSEVSVMSYQRKEIRANFSSKTSAKNATSISGVPQLRYRTDGVISVQDYSGSSFENQSSCSADVLPVVGKYEILKRLGQGSFGCVFEVCRIGNTDGCRYALKSMQVQHMNTEQLLKAKEEASILKKLKHLNIIECVDDFTSDNGEFCIIMDLANYGDLSKLIKNKIKQKTCWPKSFILIVLEQIVAGLNHAHEKNTMHRDLKPANVLVCALGTVHGDDWELVPEAILFKLSDFGLARVMDTSKDYASTQCGTRVYMSSEAHEGKYSFSTDIWSVGCMLYELCMLQRPITMQTYSLIFRGSIPRISWESSSGEDWSQLRNLCTRMLIRKKPKKRPTCKQILEDVDAIRDGTYKMIEEDQDDASDHSDEDVAKILEIYPDGYQMCQEALQNVEDVKCSTFKVILDKRPIPAKADPENPMTRFLGPALVFQNDREMSKENWKSFWSVMQSEKAERLDFVGKFGMGSRSYFHLTDLQIWISGNRFARFDPFNVIHRKKSSSRSYKIDEGRIHPIEAAALSIPELGVDLSSTAPVSDKTMIRLPLRNEYFDKEKTFGDGVYPVEDVELMLNDFIQELSDGKIVLFLTHVKTVEVYIKDENGLHKRAEVNVNKTQVDKNEHWSPWAEMKTTIKQRSELSKLNELAGQPLMKAKVQVDFKEFQTKTRQATRRYSRRASVSAVDYTNELKNEKTSGWDIISTVCLDKQLVDLKLDHPEISIALAEQISDRGGVIDGHVFNMFPTPIITGFPVHLNGPFEVTQDRRDLKKMASDLAGKAKDEAEWNKLLLQKAFPRILCEGYKQRPGQYHLWPISASPQLQGVVEPLANLLKVAPILVGAEKQSCTPEEAYIVDFGRMQDSVNDVIQFSKTIGIKDLVDVPADVCDKLQEWNVCTINSVFDLFVRFLDTSQTWQDDFTAVEVFSVLFLRFAPRTIVSEERNKFLEVIKPKCDFAWVPMKETGKFMRPCDALDPRRDDIQNFHVAKEQHFPNVQDDEALKIFVSEILEVLSLLGMKSTLTWADVVAELEYVDNFESGKMLLDYIIKVFDDEETVPVEFHEPLITRKWLPVNMPSQIYNQASEDLLSIEQAFPRNTFDAIWTVRPSVVCELPNCLASLQASQSVTVEDCVQQILNLSTIQDLQDKIQHTRAVFDALNPLVQEEQPQNSVIERLHDCNWVPADVGEDDPVWLPFDRVARDVPTSIMPNVGRLWRQFSGYTVFQRIPQQVPAPLLINLIESDNCKNVEFCCAAAAEIAERIRGLTNEGKEDEVIAFKHQIRIPSQDNKLESATNLCNIDYDTSAAPAGISFVHQNLNPDDARILGCQSLRERLEDSSVSGDDFGQEEDLEHRISQLVAELGILDSAQEILKHADDFGTDRVLFLLDETSYSTNSIVDERTKDLQGPALIIAFSKPVSSYDIQKMQQLPSSKKNSDYSTSGYSSLGVNAMYTFSDCPQLLANGALHFFDVQRKFVAKHFQPRGKRYEANALESLFQDTMAPFRFLDTTRYPTIFRLPLRRVASTLGSPVNLSFQQLRSVVGGRQALIFARNVCSVSLMRQHGNEPPSSFRVEKLHRAEHHLPRTIEEIHNLEDHPVSRAYSIEMHITSDEEKTVEKWVFAQALYLDTEGRTLHDEFLREQMAVLPEGAVAHLVESSNQDDRDTVNHFLHLLTFPIEPLDERVPFDIHAPFFTTSNRRHVLTSQHQDGVVQQAQKREEQWNAFLFHGPVALAIRELMAFEREQAESDYTNRFAKMLAQPADKNPWLVSIRDGVRQQAEISREENLRLVDLDLLRLLDGSQIVGESSSKG
eukprot:gene950-874_t